MEGISAAGEASTLVDTVEGSGTGGVQKVGGGGCPRCAGWPEALIRARTAAHYWQAMHRRAVEREETLTREVEALAAKVRQRERELCGRRSERRGKSTGERGASTQDGKQRGRGQQPGARGHGRRRHDHLPATVEAHELPEDAQHCTVCQQPFAPFDGTEDSEVVEVEVRAHRRVIRRRRYVRTCRCPGQPGIITAPVPARLIPKGSLGVSVWVMLLIDTFLFQRPTYRLLADLRLTDELDIAQGTVTDGLKRLRPLFEPIYEAITRRNVSDNRWHADEPRWLVFDKVEGTPGYLLQGGQLAPAGRHPRV